MRTVEVRFTRDYVPYAGGERAGFTEAEAEKLVKRFKVAVYVDTLTSHALETEALKTPPANAVTPAPAEQSAPVAPAPAAPGGTAQSTAADEAHTPAKPAAVAQPQPTHQGHGKKHRR